MVLAGFYDGVDEGEAVVVGGFVVVYEGVDGFADAGVGGEDCVYAAGGLV